MKAILLIAAVSIAGLSSASSINMDLINCQHCKCGSSKEADTKCDTKVGEKTLKKSAKKS